jgi:phage-related protein
MFPNAGINLSVTGTGQDVIRGISDQLRNVQGLVNSAMRSAVGNISSIYQAAFPKMPTGAVAPVGAGMAAMTEVANISQATSADIARSVTAVAAALESLVGPNMAAESSSEAFAQRLAVLPPEVGQLASALRAVLPTLTSASVSTSGLEGVLGRLQTVMAGQPVSAQAAADAIRQVTQASVEIPSVTAVATGGMVGLAGAEGEVAQQGLSAASSEQIFAELADRLTKQVANQASQITSLSSQMAEQTNQTRRLVAENSSLATSLERARNANENLRRTQTKGAGSFSTTIKHSYAATRGMDIFSSAMQGAMLTASLMRGQLIGIAMSVYFLRYAILPIFALFAVLTGVWYGILKPIQLFIKNLREAGKTAQDVMTQFSALAQNVATGTQMWAASAMWAIRYGYSLEEARKAMVEFWRGGMLSNDMMKAAAALAAAWNISLTEATSVLTGAVGETERDVDSLKKYGITVDGVTETTDKLTAASKIAQATLDRFGNVVEDRLKTISGASAKAGAAIKWFWEVFTEPVARNVVAPIISGIGDFVSGLAGLIAGLWQSSEVQGYFNETLNIARKLAIEYAPELSFLAGVIRSVVVGAFWALQMGLRGVVRVGEIFLGWLKNIRASISAASGPIKALADMFRLLSGAWKGITFADLLQKAKELLANLPGVLGVLGSLVITLVDSAITVWQTQGWRLVGDFLLYVFSVKVWKALLPKATDIPTALGLFVADFMGRVFIQAIPNITDSVRTMLNQVFDFTMWSAAIGPILLQLVGVIGPKIGLGFLGVFAGLPAWAAIGISVAIGSIIGILDAKLGLGIHDWITGIIPQNAEDWRQLWNGISSTFSEKILPFITTDLPGGLTSIATTFGTWLSKPWDLTPWASLWDQFKSTVTNAVSGTWLQDLLDSLSKITLPKINLPEISFPKIDLSGLSIPGAETLGKTLMSIGESLGKIGGILGPILGGIKDAAWGTFQGIWEVISSRVEAAGKAFEGAWKTVKEFIGGLAEGLAPVMEVLGPRLEHIGGLVVKLGGQILNVGVRAVNNWIAVFTWLWGKVSPVLGWLGILFGGVAKAIGSVTGEIIDRMLPTIEDFWGTISRVFGLVGSLLGGVIAFIVNNVTGFIDIFLTLITEGPKAAFDRLLVFISDTVTLCQNIVSGWVEKIKELWAPIADWFSTVGSKIKDAAIKLWEEVKENVTTRIGGLVQNIKDAIEDARTWLETAWNTIKTTAEGLWTGFKDTISGIVTGFVTGVQTAISTAVTWLGERWGDIKKTASTLWGEISGAVTGFVSGLVSGVQAFFIGPTGLVTWLETKWGEIKTKAGEIWGGITSGVTTEVQNIYNAIIGKIQEVRDWMGKTFGIISELTAKGAGLVRGIVVGIGNVLGEKVTGLYDTLTGGISTGITKMGEWITTSIETVKQVGKDIINGIIKGVGGMLDALGNALWDLVQDAFDWVKGKLTGSPAPMFIPLGVSIVQGIMAPFATLEGQMSGAILSAVKQASKTAGTAINTMPAINVGGAGFVGGGGGFAGFAAAGAGGQSIVIDIHGNNFSGDNAPDQIADKIVDALTDRLRLRGVVQTGRW